MPPNDESAANRHLGRHSHHRLTRYVFFDAAQAPRGLPFTARECGLAVRYCRDTDADQAIIDHVMESGRRGEYLVVTDDRELAGRARQHGARTTRVADWFDRRTAQPGPETKPEEGAGGFRPEDFGVQDLVNLDHPPHDLRDD